MPSEPPDRVPSAPQDDNSSQGSKRRKASRRSPRTPHEPDNANDSSMGRRTLSTSSPQRGSSRDMTPPESAGSIKYTRTGRVSKATKGQRVHHCDDCGKTYTRAEHLRRHQQNHKPGGYSCDVAGCSRSFYREDLLTRHKAKHDDPAYSPSGQASPSSHDSASVGTFEPIDSFLPLSRRSTLGQSPGFGQSEIEPVDGRQTFRTSLPPAGGQSSRKHPPTLSSANTLQVSLDPNIPWPDLGIETWQWSTSSPYPSSGYESPTNGAYYPTSGPPYFQPQFGRARHSSDASYLAYNPYPQSSRSPVSAGSSTLHLPLQWGQNLHGPSFPQFEPSFGPDTSFRKGMDLYNGLMAGQSLPLNTFDTQQLLTPEDRDRMEFSQLLIPTPSPHSSSQDLSLDELNYSNDERYLGAYWRWIHPFYPIVHRPSFVLASASPLLRAAILALGAHALTENADKRNAKIIHERCMKVIQKRTLDGWHAWHPFRTSDMQAMVLIEVYAIFKSRRPPLQLSKTFQEVYQTLANDVSAVSGELPSDPMQATSAFYLDEIALAVDIQAKQRLFLACYMLDQQHAALFGRQKSDCFSGTGMDLPFPRSQASWDTMNARYAEATATSRVCDALDGTHPLEGKQRTYDVFQSMLMMASMEDTASESPAYVLESSISSSSALLKMEQSSRVKMAYHTFMLCKNTPVRDLLAIAGESWVMAEKLSNQAEYTAAQIETRHWAKGRDDSVVDFDANNTRVTVSKAVNHALQILKLHLDHPKTGLLFQEWAVYLASVVLWARAHVTAPKLEQGRRLSVAKPTSRRSSLRDLDQELPGVLAAASAKDVTIDQAKTILLWAKARIETVDIPHNCGLTNGALDVLGKLATRGGEEGWFGS